MSKSDAAPTVAWVFISHINKFIVRVCLFLLACLIVAAVTLVARVDADCRDVARYDFGMFGYEVHFAFNKSEEVCA